ncbi:MULTISPECIES: CerR family C-terminal domain-containing protein [unclassified Ensifer]|uniref:CerR family C-terminal domain-containing protein n=1 Tax=unclassified Ensifer TaxID=2633371 RepID=UPI000812F7E7|nr:MULTISPECIES: CerR family C-terminal domain-containing protein [unclassified Ensifer]OCO98444.1 TetR family transcriptional regulator [Ensifer sp. LC11]OCP05577.1 TetR family transcriptional regulator [Ensifer sp. LC13]OCP13550.1 TetR family transcriptional regulator [Ensifer sp. LC14]OCP30747.1 TetR family transcriptional regulator [Ensifer sp. LC499]
MMKKESAPQPTKQDRGDATREKLLTSSIDVFGRYGFDGATTRVLAETAGVNLQAIPYYFGGKEGLYIAAAEHLASIIIGHVAELRNTILARLAHLDGEGRAMGSQEARDLLTQMAQRMIALFVSRQSESWARFIIREQMEPTEAFERVYSNVMGPMIGMAGRLVATILGEPVQSEHVRLKTLSFVGSILVFRMAHAAVLRQMNWQAVGPDELDLLRRHTAELVTALGSGKEGQS